MQPQRKPPQFKSYPGLEPLLLPDDLSPGPSLDLATLARLLFLTAGVVRVLELDGERLWFRAAGSAGNLGPVEVYVVTGDLPGLDAGVYHYAPVEHGLARLAEVPADVAPSLVLTGVPWRTAWKYTERGYRHLWWDAGTMLAHTLALAAEAGWDVRLALGFVDDEVGALVGARAPFELPLAVVGLTGEPSLPSPGALSGPVPDGRLADDPVEFPLITATHRAGVLPDEGAVEQWRAAGAGAGGAAGAAGSGGGAGFTPNSPLERVILARSSTRRFDPTAVAPAALLEGAMAWSASPVPTDFVAPGTTLLEHDLNVHAVEGVEPGAYRFGPDGLEQRRAGDVRAVSRHLCLDQALGGDSAYTVFSGADLLAVTTALGTRGYRAAQLEAGVVEGRLHLAAFALGFGATGLTFYDHEVTRFFGTAAAPMLVTAVGTPTRKARRGGPPRRPARLSPAGW